MSRPSKETIYVQTKKHKLNFERYSSHSLSNLFLPTKINPIKQTDLIDSNREKKSSSIYDQTFYIVSDFNPKMHRDDRKYSKFIGLNLAKEGKNKSYPTRSSSEYGRRDYQFNDFNQQSHVKMNHVKNDFYRNNGVFQQ